MFTKILYTIVITIFIFITTGLLLPKTVHMERTIEIDRPAATVFTLVNGFSTFSTWSPWLERDPGIVYDLSGPATGVGARLSWHGNPRRVGAGLQEITQSIPWSLVRMHVEFDQLGKASSYFQIDPVVRGTRLTWSFDADLVEGRSFFGALLNRYFALFFDHWFGAEYERGLSRLKQFAESLPAADFSDIEVEILQVEPLDILYVVTDSKRSGEGVTSGLAEAYQEITALMVEESIEMQSQPMAITRAQNTGNYELSAAIPVTHTDIALTGAVRAGKSPAGRAVRVVHRGPYDRMATSYEKLAAYMAINGIGEGRVSWEHYISDPGKTPPVDTVTHIYFLVEQ